MKPSPDALEWVRYAESDYLAASQLLQAWPVQFQIVAYHYQQSAEKYLKAVLVQHEQPVPFVHDLVALHAAATRLTNQLDGLSDACQKLTPYGVIARNPGGQLELDQVSIQHVLAWSEAIRAAVRQCLWLDVDTSNPDVAEPRPSQEENQ